MRQDQAHWQIGPRTVGPRARDRSIAGVFAGDPVKAHRTGVEFVSRVLLETLDEPVDAVITTSAGYPLDLTYYQAIKGVTAASHIVKLGGSILLVAHRAVESLTLDRGASHLKDELMPRYAELIYNGFWFSPERLAIQALIDQTQLRVAGTVRLKLYKGVASVVGRKSPNSLYRLDYVTFEADQVYSQKDAEGFIKLNALRLRLGKISERGES